MKKYKSHKVVEAAQISAAEFNADGSGRVAIVGDGPTIERMFNVPAGFKRPDTAPVMNPDGGDYLVRYEGGYLSWSPKDVFEAGYTALPETGITVTVEVPGEHSYRKKPVVVQAFQMTRERRASNAEWPAWMHEAWNKDHNEPGALYCTEFPNSDGTDMLAICTLEGNHLVSWGDYIIQGVKGELYPCKPDIFEATYDTWCR